MTLYVALYLAGALLLAARATLVDDWSTGNDRALLTVLCAFWPFVLTLYALDAIPKFVKWAHRIHVKVTFERQP